MNNTETDASFLSSDITFLLHHLGPKVIDVVISQILNEMKNILVIDLYGKPKVSENPAIKVHNLESASIVSLLEAIRNNSGYDCILINGSERMISSFSGEELFVREYNNLNIRVFTQENLEWEQLCNVVEVLKHTLHNNKVLLLVNSEHEAQQVILNIFEDNEDVDIAVMESSEKDETLEVQKKIIEVIKTKSFKEIDETIDSYSSILSLSKQNIFKAFASIRYGFKSKAIGYFEGEYSSLHSNEKVMLAELYLSNNEPEKAFELCSLIYEEDRFVHGLSRLLLKSLLARKDHDHVDICNWVQCCLELQGDNVDVLDLVANGLSRISDYQKAAKIRRKIMSLNHSPGEELLARFLDLQDNLPKDHDVPTQYILSWVSNHTQLEDEAHYRLGSFFLQYYKSDYKAFEHWSQVTHQAGNAYSYEAAKERMKLLEDNIKACKVLRINSRGDERDNKRLLDIKVNELLQNMEALSTRNKGYISWGSFIEKSYTKNTWKRGMFSSLIKEIEKWSSFDKSVLENSYLRKNDELTDPKQVENPHTALHVLRELKTHGVFQEQDDNKVSDMIKGCLMVSEMHGEPENLIWMRYEASVILSVMGKDQEAINHALSLFELAGRKNKPLDQTARMLGFLAWGNAQYRLGDIIEGISALIVSMRLSKKIEEYGAFIEDGINVIYRMVLDEPKMIPKNQMSVIIDFFEKNSHFIDDNHAAIRIATLTDNYEAILKILQPTVISPTSFDTQWAADFANYIASCIKTDRKDEALDLIIKYSEKAIIYLQARKDLLPRCLQSWSQVLISSGENNAVARFRLARKLLEEAIRVSDTRRSEVYHRSERANLADQHRNILVDYLEILAIIYQTKDFLEEEKHLALIEMVRVFSLTNSMSVLESRMADLQMTEELIEMEKEYNRLSDEIMSLEHSDTKQELVRRYDELQKQLKQIHPYYRALSKLDNLSVCDDFGSMEENEVFIQYVVLKFGIAILIVNKDGYKVEYLICNTIQFRNLVESLGHLLQGNQSSNKEENLIYQKFTTDLSKPILLPLKNFLKNMDGEYSEITIYLCPDLSLPLFSSNLLNDEGTWIIQKVKKITNVLHFGQLLNRDVVSHLTSTILIVTLGSLKDKAINIARKSLISWTKFELIKHLELSGQDDEIKRISDACKELKPSIVIVIGHGITDQNAGMLSGAVGILGHTHTIWGSDFEELEKLTDHLFLISCSGGANYEDQIESSTGVLNGILSQKFSSVVLCRWDVNAQATFEMLSYLIEELATNPKATIPTSLIQGQRTQIQSDKWQNPVYWAGVEYWGI